ncbi:hypothetical protein SAMN05421807_107151 [Virgibacillus chiguensis]|uniref:Uncharacterized protein n=1 Tax=Virgibacillus chiguensis TaxID=411959 RepID=A0A1M5T8G6_9BACI|nr:hypothetical protein SAMN05421807_107151 [Virgibacillus chiguensis]
MGIFSISRINPLILLAIEITKIPPCGAFKYPLPYIQLLQLLLQLYFAGIILNGSAAANGIAPLFLLIFPYFRNSYQFITFSN